MPKVLLVDDDRNVVMLLKTLLQLEKFTVALESRAEEVLPTIWREQPDIVLMDVHLADADGLQILAEIRQDPALAKTRVVIASGEDVSYQCQQAGANDFVLKPYSPDHLISIIRKVLLA